MSFRCPGQEGRNLKVDLYKCPYCGYEVEIFSDELKAKCPHCKRMVYRESVPSCLDWCAAAKICLGPTKWEELRGKKKEES